MALEWNDATDLLTVKRWFKRHKMEDKASKEIVDYKVYLDYGLYSAKGGAFHIAGSPLQLYTEGILGDSSKDTRILVQEEELPLSHIENSPPTYKFDGNLHYKFPNV